MKTKSCKKALEADELKQLEQWLNAHGTPQQVVMRSRVAIEASGGMCDTGIAALLGINRHTARLWRQRVASEGNGAVWRVASGRGRKVRYGSQEKDDVVKATLESKPAGQTHWSCRTMAATKGMSKNTVNRLWQLHNLKPHLHKTFKLSRDPRFLEKMTDVIGLYLNPPDKAVVLCVDEKSQIQALDRTQPGLPLKKGRCGTFTHDYKRNGTTTLFAALNMLDGRVIGQCQSRHRHQEWLKFMRRLDREFPSKLTLHVVMDNYGTHKSPAVKEWLEKHPRFVYHFIPTSSSWLNMVERWFRELTDKTIRRGAFVSVPDLVKSIFGYLDAWNEKPRPFIWMATAGQIMEKLARARKKLEALEPGCTHPGRRKTRQL